MGDSEKIDPASSTRPQSRLGVGSSGSTPTPALTGQKSGDGLPVSNVNGSKPVNVVDPTAAYENRSIVHAPTRLAINVLKKSSDAFTPLKSVAECLTAVLKYYHQPMGNRKRIESLIPRVEGLAESLRAPAREGDIKEIRRRQVLRRKLEKPLRDLGLLEAQGKKEGFLNTVEDAETLTDLAEDVRDAVMDCQAALQQDLFGKNTQLADKEDLLKGMPHTADAGFSARNRSGCLRGTRKGVLLELEQWSMNENAKRFLWLTGPVGTGKSTIAQTFSEISFFDGRLGASFFCSQGIEDRRNLQLIFPSLAFQLSYRYPQFREQLLQVLKTNSVVGKESLNTQLEKLIVGPLKATGISTLIIIDALDECPDEGPVSALLSALSHYAHEIPEVKFFISCRPEPLIRQGFLLEPLRNITVVLKLQDVKRSLVDEDIRLYLKTHLRAIPKLITHDEFPEEWLSSYDIDVICKKAAGLFIYASAVINFIASKIHKPTKRLDRIILRSQLTDIHEAAIDTLYSQFLVQEFYIPDRGEQDPYSNFKRIVGAALLVFHPLSRKALSDIFGGRRNTPDIPSTLYTLHSLLDVPDNEDDPIRAFHPSFPSFLTDKTRCEDQRFFVEPSVPHKDILFSCLSLMKERLEKNICGLDDYAVLSEVENLSALKETRIGSSLEYACRFWARHLASIPGNWPQDKRLPEAIDGFLTERLLSWIEVLSIVGHLGAAAYAINNIRQWYISAGISPSKNLYDVERLILEHFDGIRESPSHVYHSALPLSPSSSWLRECYKAELVGEAKVPIGLQDKWETCSRRVSVEGEPSAFAHWGDVIGVGLGSSRVALLDAITGSSKHDLLGHTGTILSLAFSLDGTLLVSGSEDKTVKIWDVHTGDVIKTFSDNTCAILAISISPDHTTIASGTEDGTIRLWDVRTGQCRPIILCHDGRVTAVSFSPIDSRTLISSSWDRTVRRWDVDGHKEPACHEAGRVAHVAYSSDGTRFVSCGGTVAMVRDAKSGKEVVKLDSPKEFPPLRFCCFSPNGNFVACAAATTIYVWNIANSGAQLVGNLVGHSTSILSLSFTSFLTSVSPDRFFKVWQSSSFLVDSTTTGDTPPQLDSTPIESIRLFAEEDTLVTSDSFGVVKIWDLKTGTCGPPFTTPARGVQDTHLVGDNLIVVWWEVGDKNYRVWVVGDEDDKVPRTVSSSLDKVLDLRISGDGSTVFGLGGKCIEARSIHTGQYVCRVKLQDMEREGGLVVHGYKVWLEGTGDMGWDFGGEEVCSFSLSREFPDRPRLHLVDPSQNRMVRSAPAWVQDTVTGRLIFHLPERCMKLGTRRRVEDGYLLIWSRSGEVVVVDLSCALDVGS